MFADKAALLREGQNEMQEQSGLQKPGRDVAPVDSPVKLVQLSSELEGVENERDQAEDIEMRGARCRPAPQQNVKPDAQIDQSDETKPVVERALSRDQNHCGVQRNRLPNQRVCCLRPGANPVHLTNPRGGVLHLALVDRSQAITHANARLLSRSVCFHPVGYQTAIAAALFHPPNAI